MLAKVIAILMAVIGITLVFWWPGTTASLIGGILLTIVMADVLLGLLLTGWARR